MNFYDAWWFLNEHSYFNHPDEDIGNVFKSCLDVDVQKVNPDTHCISDDESLNTFTEVWLEAGPLEYVDMDGSGELYLIPSHDVVLDCGAPTFEEAIVKLAELVKKHYGEK